MKKLKSLFFSFLPISAAVAGVATVMTGCASSTDIYYEGNQARIVTSKDVSNSTKYANLPTTSNKLCNLISGTTEYNEGNYIFIIGHKGDANNDKLILKPGDTGDSWNWKGANDIFTALSGLGNDFTHPSDLLIYQDIAPSYETIDQEFPGIDWKLLNHDSNNLEEKYFDLSATGLTWNSSDLNYLKNPFVKYSNADNAQVTESYRGQYVRNDEAAKQYRSLIDNMKKLTNLFDWNNFKSADPLIIMYKVNKDNGSLDKNIINYDGKDNIGADIANFYKNNSQQ